MSKKLKKKWGKPRLIVLIRGHEPEMVLSACKANIATSGPPGFFTGCYGGSSCTACSVLVGS